jgi:hypothetical protein
MATGEKKLRVMVRSTSAMVSRLACRRIGAPALLITTSIPS